MEVFKDGEFRRIVALPRREVLSGLALEEAQTLLTDWLKTPGGTMQLNPIQAQAIVEFHDHGRLVAAIGAGRGKTLLSTLLGRVAEARMTLILVPAKLKTKTIDDYWDLKQHWNLPKLVGSPLPPDECELVVQSYESLGHINYAGFLSELQPDLIVCDEAHFLAHLSAGRTKRVFRYTRKERPDTKFVPMTGTFWRKSIKESAHLFEAAAGKESPLPTDWNTLESWAASVDEGVRPEARVKPGALLSLCSEDEREQGLDGVRVALRRRVFDTPGFVSTTDAACPIPLVVQTVDIQVPQSIKDALRNLRDLYELPDGSDVGEPLLKWAAARQLACGFYYQPDPPPPPEWARARRAWNSFVRDRMARPGNLQLDTPLQVWNACRDGRFGEVQAFNDWVALRNTFEMKTKPRWVSDFLVRAAEDWAIQNKGIVWCGHTAVDDSQDDDAAGNGFTRIPYFGAGQGDALRRHRGPCAASIKSHGTGLNLQHYHKALIMCLPSSGATLEQLLARHHRQGQTAPMVEFYWFCHTQEIANALTTAMNDAKFAEATLGNPQRILRADLLDSAGHNLDTQRLPLA